MKSVLLVIDFINDIIHPNGKIATSAVFIKNYQTIKHANEIIAFARTKNIPIIFVKVGFNIGYADGPVNSPVFGRIKELGALQLNTWGTEFHEEMNIKPDDTVIVKPRISAFYATPLEAFLRAKQIQHIMISGISTDMAVQTTARDAHDRDYKITVIANACGAASIEIHKSVLKLLSKVSTIVDSDHFIKNL